MKLRKWKDVCRGRNPKGGSLRNGLGREGLITGHVGRDILLFTLPPSLAA